jgi:hypothetical protein
MDFSGYCTHRIAHEYNFFWNNPLYTQITKANLLTRRQDCPSLTDKPQTQNPVEAISYEQ